VARANLLALTSPASGAVNIGTGQETSVNELARLLSRAAGYGKPIRHGPAAAGEQRRSCVDARAAIASLGWEPRVPLHEGLVRTTEWFRQRSP
jgi:UDP-glucose 4-epimerase